MTEPVRLEHPDLPGQTIRVERQSLRFYLPGGWVEAGPVPELTAADLEAAPLPAAAVEPAVELAEDEPEPDPETLAQEES